MSATVEDVINAPVDPAWIGVAAELITAFPQDSGPRERLRLLFAALHERLGITDWIACAAVHSRMSALGHMDQGIRIGDLHLAGDNPDADATASLHAEGENLAFDPVSFQRCFALRVRAARRHPSRSQSRATGNRTV